jgi:hypothetical protein
MDAEGVLADAPLRVSASSTSAIRPRRGSTRELDAGCLTDQTASSVAPGEIFRLQRPTVGQLDADAGVVLRETPSRPRQIGTASSPTQPAGMRSMWFCHSPSE